MVHHRAAPSGIPLRVLGTQEDVVRLTPVWQRGMPLGADEIAAIAAIAAISPHSIPFADALPRPPRRRTGSTPPCSSRPRATPRRWRALLRREADRGPDVLRLGNALAALDPRGGEEKRHIDAMF